MAEESQVTCSQESLPLSQETYFQLLSQLPCPMNSLINDVTSMNIPIAQEFPSMVNETNNFDSNISTLEQIGALCSTIKVPNESLQHTINVPEQKYAPSSLPASEIWPGKYSFNVSFNPQENVKGVSWIYSKLKNKLFVGRNVPCPINFLTNSQMTDDVCIRAMVLFSSSDHASEVVHRCINHSMTEITQGVFEAEHLIRSESSMAHYEVDDLTKCHSVVIPFENPPAGQHFSSYIYKFACFNSCSGGPNRRPLMLVFTLEKKAEVIGRYKVDLKICACPGRDMRLEENSMLPNVGGVKKEISLKRKEPTVASNILMPDTCSSKKQKSELKKNEPYKITAPNRDCYEFLKQMKRYFMMYSIMKTKLPTDFQFIFSFSSDEDMTDQ